ncbi:hypothetical protein L914_19122 [Phytophthora nicotianae]|uniref:Uncharacterized protein n=1 Tax=Phytophthora nicotianae TaxID=4792 RepID=W2MBG6_PHYNI|nr:hypothetical protein L914_19122 [Phytophthora nicotianae]
MEKMLVQGNGDFGAIGQIEFDANAAMMMTQLDHNFCQQLLASYEHDHALRDIVTQFKTHPTFEHPRFCLEGGPLKLKGKGRTKIVVLPVIDEIILRVLHDYHDNSISAHPGVDTYLLGSEAVVLLGRSLQAC